METGHEVLDLGTRELEHALTYIKAADNVSQAVLEGRAERGIVFCGSGSGVAIVANKHKGIYCVPAESLWSACKARFINNANVLALGGSILGAAMARDMADIFLHTEFHGGAAPERAAVLENLLAEVKELEDQLF